MPDWRKTLGKALGKIHAHLGVPAVYLTHAAGTPVRLNVQAHIPNARHENEFTFVSTPGLLDLTPRLEFRVSDLPHSKVLPKTLVFLSPSEIYITGPSRPPRDGFVEVEVSEANASIISTYTAPFDANGYGAEWDGIYP